VATPFLTADWIRSLGVSCEHRNNDCRGNQVQSNERELAGRRVSERQRSDTRERGEPDSDLNEPLTGCSAPSDQHGKQHPADDCTDEGDLGEPGQWDLAVHSQRDSGSPQYSRYTGRGHGGQDTGRGDGSRQRPDQSEGSVLDGDVGGNGNGGHELVPFIAAVSSAPLTMSTGDQQQIDI
jgi:hypothetical protein